MTIVPSQTAPSSEGLGTRFTPNGGRGSVLALTEPRQAGGIMEIWRQIATEAGLTPARILRRGPLVEVE